MRFLTALLLTLTPAALGYRDGVFYLTTVELDGTMFHQELGNKATVASRRWAGPDVSARSPEPQPEAAAELSKRYVDCWGRQLDTSGVDAAVQAWKNRLRSGNVELRSPRDRTSC